MSKNKLNNNDKPDSKIAPEISSQVQTLVSKALDGLRTEIIAGKVLIPKNAEDIAWNGANDRAIRILDKYRKGEGLFQLP